MFGELIREDAAFEDMVEDLVFIAEKWARLRNQIVWHGRRCSKTPVSLNGLLSEAYGEQQKLLKLGTALRPYVKEIVRRERAEDLSSDYE